MPGRRAPAASARPTRSPRTLRRFEEAGVDQVIFMQQGGSNEHDHICESLELFAKAVMPAFKRRPRRRASKKKRRSSRPTSSAALARKPRRPALRDADIPAIVALGRSRRKQESVDGKTANFGRGSEMQVPLEDPLKKAAR